MDDIIFYHPSSTSISQPRRLPSAATSSIAPRASIASFSARQTASQLDQRSEMSKNQMAKPRDVSDLSQESHSSDQHCRDDTIQEQDNLTATRKSPNSDDYYFLPDIDKLLLDRMQKNNSVGGNPNGDDDNGFIDINDFLSGTQQKSMPAMVDDGTRGGSPPDSSRSTAGSTHDPTILSDDEFVGAESETDYSDHAVDLAAKGDSHPPHVANGELADGDGFGSGAPLIFDRLVTDHRDDDNNHNSGVVDKTQLRLSADRPRSAFPDPGSETQIASKLQVNTDITQGSTSYDNLDVAKELEGEGFDVSAEGNDEDDGDTRVTKERKLSVVSDTHPAFHGNISIPRDGQPNYTQSPHFGSVAASPHQSDLKTNHLPKQIRRGATGNARRKRPRTKAHIGLASTAGTASAAFESSDLDIRQPRTQIMALDQETVSDSKRGGRPRSRKRVRQTKDMEDSDVAAPPTHSLNVSCQAATATSSGSKQESEEIPIYGYLTLKTIESKVVYCLTFSQELLPRQDQGQRQDTTTDLEEPQSVAQPRISHSAIAHSETGHVTSRPSRKRVKWTSEEDATLVKMREENNCSWEEISAALPSRNPGAIQVRYSTKFSKGGTGSRKHQRS